MKKAILLFTASIFLFSNEMEVKKVKEEDYRFPEAFLKDNNLEYERVDNSEKAMENIVTKEKMKVKQEIRQQDTYEDNRQIKEAIYKSSSGMYLAPSIKKRTDIYMAGLGIGFFINKWISTELLAKKSFNHKKYSMFDIANEYSLNVVDTRYIRAYISADVSLGGLFDKKDKEEDYFYAYGIGADIEIVINRLSLVGAYKFEQLKLKDDTSNDLNIYSIKLKYTFPL